MKITINLDGYDVGADVANAAQVVASAWKIDPNVDIRIKGLDAKDKASVWYKASRLFDMGAKR
jgi:hypothetical protein